MIRGIVFDKDGTLFDFRASWGRWAQGFLTQIARDDAHARQLAAAIGYLPDTNNFDPSSPVIAGTAKEIAGALLPHLEGHTLESLTQQIDAVATGVPMSEAVPLRALFEEFRARGLKLGVATNDSEIPARAHLERHGLTDLLDFIAGWDSGHGAKPGPGMCLAFATATGLDPAEVLMVGDSLHDLHAGQAAGMRPIAVLTGIAGEADLAPHAEVVLADIGGLPAWMDAQVAR
ncbi:HAD family hydrolase [Xinfangfangia sp. CPCC 101601]|uniref:phosphoglycolate phosphatase n=1 Tax=Pseudogemmobacter lacusdianii TaxID=3069608 RepID=A0ABU0VVB0_9RHOB|nr:HAD family hydrolase [Xinfangfangia sp. CPCC 101601]MDQ2065672.1 HAD family hydrolase [Xinfangfangia sp. CPCC 101601]